MLLGVQLKGYAVFQDFSLGLSDPETLLSNETAEGADAVRSMLPLAVFVGRNSTGKTLIFEALDLLSDCLRYDIQYACNAKGRLGYSSLKTEAQEISSISFLVHILCRETAEILTWELTVGGDEFNRPRLLQEKVTGMSCTRRRLQQIGLSDRKVTFPSGLERYEGRRLYLQVEEGEGTVSAGEGETWRVKLPDLTRTALSIYGALPQFPSLNALVSQVRRWYFCRPEKDEKTFFQAAEKSRLAGAQSRVGGGHKHLDEYLSNTENFLIWFKQKHPEAYRGAMQDIGYLLGRGDRLHLNRLLPILQGNEGRLFKILLLLHDPAPRPLIMLENPDSGLFYDRVESLGEAMRRYVIERFPGVQLFFSTHNNSLLDLANPAEVWNYERTANKGVKATCLADIPMVAAMYEEGIALGAQWYSGHFDTFSDLTEEAGGETCED